jgi:membrane fusion protein (multidrug efflux system)
MSAAMALPRQSTYETGLRNDATIQILSGLSANDTVITTGLMQMKPGVPVKVTTVYSSHEFKQVK